MKLRTLAIAVAVASSPFAAQADVSIGGDVTVGYYTDGTGADGAFDTRGTELILTGSEKVGGLTFGGSTTLNIGSQGSAGDTDDTYVYVSGGFGKVSMGEVDNGCDAVDTGWVAPDTFISHSSGGCTGEDTHHITYSKTSGNVSYAASYSPEGSADMFAVGIKGKIGPVTASIGYEDGDGIARGGSNVVYGLSGAIGPVSVGVRANEYDDGTDMSIGYTAAYSAGGTNIYMGIGDTVDAANVQKDTKFLGFSRKIGSNNKVALELVDDSTLSDTKVAVGLIHSF